MANLCIKTPSSAIQVLIFQFLVLRPRPIAQVPLLLFGWEKQISADIGLGQKLIHFVH